MPCSATRGGIRFVTTKRFGPAMALAAGCVPQRSPLVWRVLSGLHHSNGAADYWSDSSSPSPAPARTPRRAKKGSSISNRSGDSQTDGRFAAGSPATVTRVTAPRARCWPKVPSASHSTISIPAPACSRLWQPWPLPCLNDCARTRVSASKSGTSERPPSLRMHRDRRTRPPAPESAIDSAVMPPGKWRNH